MRLRAVGFGGKLASVLVDGDTMREALPKMGDGTTVC